ncbi:MAG: hypothetical protein V7782_02080, partial [Psychromonas sp.]
MLLRKTLLALSTTLLFVACANSETGNTVKATEKVAIDIQHAKRALDQRLVCNQPNSAEAACNLRI